LVVEILYLCFQIELIMKTENEKYYLVKLKYEIVDLKEKKKKRTVYKTKKMLLSKNLEHIENSFENLEQELETVTESTDANVIGRLVTKIRTFGAKCDRTYHNVLRT